MSTQDEYALIDDFDPSAQMEEAPRKYPGWNRRQYLIWYIAVHVFIFATFFLAFVFDFENMSDSAKAVLTTVMLVSLFGYFFGQALLAIPRFRNQLASRWWALTFFIPIIGIYAMIRACAYPPGYNEHRSLDTPAKLILGFFLAFGLLAAGSVFYVLINKSSAQEQMLGRSIYENQNDAKTISQKVLEQPVRKLTTADNDRLAGQQAIVPRTVSKAVKQLQSPKAQAQLLYEELSEKYPYNFSHCVTIESSQSQCQRPESMPWKASQSINIEVILDVSGSMAGRIDGSRKIDIARKALRQFVEAVDENANIALRIYGHKGSNQEVDKAVSCQSSELVVGFHPLGNGSRFMTALQRSEPVGFTPIARSLQRAAADFSEFNSEGNANFVYLISDGLETCGGDPVAAAKALSNQVANTIINVIGFDVASEEQRALQAVASAGDGQYHNAATALELEEVLTTSVDWHEWKRYIACSRNSARNHIVDYQKESRRQVWCALDEGSRIEKLFRDDIKQRKANGDKVVKKYGSQAMLTFYQNRSKTMKPFMQKYSNKDEYNKYQQQLREISEIEQ